MGNHVFSGWHIDDLRLYFECHHAGAKAHQYRQENLANRLVTYNDIVFELVVAGGDLGENMTRLLANVHAKWGNGETTSSAKSDALEIINDCRIGGGDAIQPIREVNGIAVNYIAVSEKLIINKFHKSLFINHADLLIRNDLMEICDELEITDFAADIMKWYRAGVDITNFMYGESAEIAIDGEIKMGKNIGRHCNTCPIKNCEFNYV